MKNTPATTTQEDDLPASIDDLRVLVREIKTFWRLGDNQIVEDARTALLAVLHQSAKRLK